MNPFLTVKEVAQLLQLSEMTIRRMVWENKLPAIRFNNRTLRFHVNDIQEYLKKSSLQETDSSFQPLQQPEAVRKAIVIAMVNHKGGVGKTITTLNVGAGLAMRRFKVLLIDADAQANLTTSVGLSQEEEKTLHDIFTEKKTLEEVIIHRENQVDIIASSLDLSGVEMEMMNAFEREKILSHALETVKSQYDFILIDCPPALDICTKNALVAADKVIIPVSAEFLPLRGLDKIVQIIDVIARKRVNPNLEIGGILVTQFVKQQSICRQTVEILESMFGEKVFTTKIRENVSLKEMAATNNDIFQYAPTSLSAIDYMNLTDEIISRFIKQ